MDIYENKLPDATDLDTFNILCSFAIFSTNIIGALYIVWRVVPIIKSTNSIDKCFKPLESASKVLAPKLVEPVPELPVKFLEKPSKKRKKKSRKVHFDLVTKEQLPTVRSKGSGSDNVEGG